MKYKTIYYKLHNNLDTCEILHNSLNRLAVRVKRPLVKGDVLQLQWDKHESYAEVISQQGCEVVLWERG